MQTEKTIDEASNKGNNSLEEYISPVFTTACTTIEISKLERDTIREVLEETFFLHESFSYLRVDEYGWNVHKGTDIIDRRKGHSREGIRRIEVRPRSSDDRGLAVVLCVCSWRGLCPT